MPGPRAVVVPFGVPPECRGLGLGLAAVLHAHAHLGGESIALAQLHAKQEGAPESARPEPVEAFMPAATWRDLQRESGPPASVEVIITGAFEPPTEGRGLLQLLAFDARSFDTRARVETVLDERAAGDGIVLAFGELAGPLGIELGALRELAGLPWEALESVLLGERAALHDPLKGAPHDRLAPLVHLGRAVADAPDGRYPAARLTTFALEAVLGAHGGARYADTARRALETAAIDAPEQVDLVEGLSVLCMRTGDAAAAEAHAADVIARAPARPRPHAILAEARRARGDVDGALTALAAGLAARPGDPFLCVERGIVLAQTGDLDGASIAWREVLMRFPGYPAAFANLAQLALDRKDAAAAQALVDAALGAADPHPEVLRRAIELAHATESEGIARASRVATLARALIERVPDDASAILTLAQCLSQMGERDAAVERLREVERLAPNTPLAAEAQRGLFAIREPAASAELDAVLRAARTAADEDLEAVAARARRIALVHGVWIAHFALGLTERRRGRADAARAAFQAAIDAAPGCLPAHAELAELAGNSESSRPTTTTTSAPPPSGGPFARLRDSFMRWRQKE